MNAHVCRKALPLTDGDGNQRLFQLSKLPALTGLSLLKRVLTRVLPLAKNLLPSGDTGNKKELKAAVKNLDSSILDRIQLEQVAQVLNDLTDEDLQWIARICLTNVYEVLPAQATTVMHADNGTYQVEGVEYDPVLFITLIWEELKFGLADFFKGDRWLSLLPDSKPAESSLSSPASM